MSSQISIWDKVSPPSTPPDDAQEPSSDAPASAPAARVSAIFNDPNWKWKRRALDSLGTLAWSYALLKVFAFDADRALAASVAPGAQWLIDARFLVFLALFALAVVALRTPSLLFSVTYIGLFPLIVLLWKLPRRLLRLKSWVATFAVINVATDTVAHFKYVVGALALFAISATTILAVSNEIAVGLAALAIGTLLATALARTIWYSWQPSRFISMQEQTIERILRSEPVASLTKLDDEFTSAEIAQFDDTQQGQFLMKVVTSTAVNRALYFWGYQLDRYRQSSAPFLYSALSYLWLLAQTIVVLTLVNWSLLKIDGESFTYDTAPSLLVTARYSFSSMIGSEITALQAHSDAANLVSLLGMFIGIAVLFGIVLTIFTSLRRDRQNAVIRDTLMRIDQLGRELEIRHRDTYGLSIQATLDKLEELGYVLRGMATFFASRIPPEWAPGDARERPPD